MRNPPAYPRMTGRESMLEGALAWARAGWYVLPAAPGKKHPGSVVGMAWESKATRDPQQITRWFDAHPDRGLGICPGRSDMLVLDIDSPEDWDEPVPLPDDTRRTYTRPASRDRFHVPFVQPDGDPVRCGARPWGDVRGAGGFIMVFPSVHPVTGDQYGVPSPTPAEPLPDALLARLDRKPAGDQVSAVSILAGEEFLCREWQARDKSLGPRLVEKHSRDLLSGGSRHSTLVSSLTWLTKRAVEGDVDPKACLPRMLRDFQTAVSDRSTPNEAEIEFEEAVLYAVQVALDHEETLTPQSAPPTSGTFADVLQWARGKEAEQAAAAEEAELQALDDAAAPDTSWLVADEPDPANEWVLKSTSEMISRPRLPQLVAGTLPATGVANLIGGTYEGKTYLALDLAMSVATSQVTEWAGNKILAHGHVVYWLLEGEEDFGSRINAWQRHHGMLPDLRMDTLQGPGGLSDGEVRSAFVAAMRETYATIGGVALMVIDTQSLGFSELEENSNTEMNRMLIACKEISRSLGCLVLLVHHSSSKGERNDRDPARGASAVRAGMDVVLEAQRDPESGSGLLRVTKFKPGVPWMQYTRYTMVTVPLPPRGGEPTPDSAVAVHGGPITLDEAQSELALASALKDRKQADAEAAVAASQPMRPETDNPLTLALRRSAAKQERDL